VVEGGGRYWMDEWEGERIGDELRCTERRGWVGG